MFKTETYANGSLKAISWRIVFPSIPFYPTGTAFIYTIVILMVEATVRSF